MISPKEKLAAGSPAPFSAVKLATSSWTAGSSFTSCSLAWRSWFILVWFAFDVCLFDLVCWLVYLLVGLFVWLFGFEVWPAFWVAFRVVFVWGCSFLGLLGWLVRMVLCVFLTRSDLDGLQLGFGSWFNLDAFGRCLVGFW